MRPSKLVPATIALFSAASSLEAQQWSPPVPTNLKVFAKGTTGRQLMPSMRGYTQALGVRCQHCHVFKGENPDDLSTFDFASDEKPAKITARTMMRMVTTINDEMLKGVGEPAAPAEPKVSCFTCHRGDKRPLSKRPAA